MEQYQKLGDHNGILHIQQSIGLLDIARGQFATGAQGSESIRSTTPKAISLPEEAAVAQVSLTELNLLEGRYADAERIRRAGGENFRAARRRARQCRNRAAQGAHRDCARRSRRCEETARCDRRQSTQRRTESRIRRSPQAQQAGAGRRAQRSKRSEARRSGKSRRRCAQRRARDCAWISSASVSRLPTKTTKPRAETMLQQIRDQTLRLNDVPLRLVWLELQTALALQNGDSRQAADALSRSVAAAEKRRDVRARRHCCTRMGELALADDPQQRAAAHAAADAETHASARRCAGTIARIAQIGTGSPPARRNRTRRCHLTATRPRASCKHASTTCCVSSANCSRASTTVRRISSNWRNRSGKCRNRNSARSRASCTTASARISTRSSISSIRPSSATAISSELLLKMRALAKQTLDETRALSRLLRPQVLDDLGLEAGAAMAGAHDRRNARFRSCRSTSAARCRRSTATSPRLIFRITQEALNNAAKHAHAQVGAGDVALRRRAVCTWTSATTAADATSTGRIERQPDAAKQRSGRHA